MARWRLKEKHYLNVPGTEWEHSETSQQSGKRGRRIFNVPRFLDPNDPADWTEVRLDSRGQPVYGEIVVAYADGKENPRDIIFTGDPTPDMEPLDDRAKEISGSFSKKWVHPIESLPSSYSESIISGLQDQIDEIGRQPNRPMPGITTQEFDALKAQVAELMEQNAKLTEKASRRV